MSIEQFVMAYGCDHDKIRSILPDEFVSLRPVFRINAEIRDNKIGYVEFNTAVQKDNFKGWLNIGAWNNVTFVRDGNIITFEIESLKITFKKTGAVGGCPAEKDNDGCFFVGNNNYIRPFEVIAANREFCDCEFKWNYDGNGAHGMSIGKTLPAVPTDIKCVYPKVDFSVKNAATIECLQVLGSYTVCFNR